MLEGCCLGRGWVACSHWKQQENHESYKNHFLRPEPPFPGVSRPKIAKKSQKTSFWGSSNKKSPKYQLSENETFSGIFGDFYAEPPKRPFLRHFVILGLESPETPVNGGLGRKPILKTISSNSFIFKTAAKICVLGSLCHLSSVPLSAP